MPLLPLLVMVLAADPAAVSKGLPDTKAMNILFIDIEDTNAGALGCYGNPICRTPHLDQLAATGVRFDKAFVQAVCCNPSRTAFLTGLRPPTTGVVTNQDVMSKKLPAGTLTLPELLKGRGLYLADIGKLFHQLDYAEKQMAAFDRIEMYDRPDGWTGPEPILKFGPVVGRRKADPPPADRNTKAFREWKRRQSDRYGDSGLKVEDEGDYRKAQTAVALLAEFAKSRRQFFLSVSQSRPHTPLVAPKTYIDRYDPAKIPLPPAQPAELVGFPYMKRATGGNPDIFTQKQPTEQETREAIAAYYACVSFVDDNVGMILDALKREGLEQNTIVVFLGDHGFHLGDHGCWSKYSLMEATRRAPLIVRVPGAPGNGQVCREIVEFVDLVPTLCELSGTPAPANLESTSFAPLLAAPDRHWKKAMFQWENGPNGPGRVVRTKTHSYMEFGRGEVRKALYDLGRDPWEVVNRAGDPAYAAVEKELADLLQAGWRAALPPGK